MCWVWVSARGRWASSSTYRIWKCIWFEEEKGRWRCRENQLEREWVVCGTANQHNCSNGMRRWDEGRWEERLKDWLERRRRDGVDWAEKEKTCLTLLPLSLSVCLASVSTHRDLLHLVHDHTKLLLMGHAQLNPITLHGHQSPNSAEHPLLRDDLPNLRREHRDVSSLVPHSKSTEEKNGNGAPAEITVDHLLAVATFVRKPIRDRVLKEELARGTMHKSKKQKSKKQKRRRREREELSIPPFHFFLFPFFFSSLSLCRSPPHERLLWPRSSHLLNRSTKCQSNSHRRRQQW